MDIKILASGSKGNCYIVSDGSTSLLLDAGISIKEIRVGCDFKLTGIGGCLVTHSHQDHAKAIKDLIKCGTDVYTTPQTVDFVHITSHRLHRIENGKQFNIGSFEVIPFEVTHDVETFGFLIHSTCTLEKLLYFTDEAYIKYKFSGLTHIMAECNYDDEILLKNAFSKKLHVTLASRIVKSHMSLDNFKSMLVANDLSNLKQIYLLHLSDSNSDAIKFKNEVQKITGVEVYIA